MKKLGMTTAAILMAATGAFAQEPQGEQAAKQEKKICKSEKLTGSLTRVRRVCLTQRQWNEIAVAHNRAIDRMGRSANHAEAMTDRDGSGGGGGHGHTW